MTSPTTKAAPSGTSERSCSALWEPVYGGSILHSWEWQGGRVWTTRCGKSGPMGSAKFNAKKCAKCLKAEAQNTALKGADEGGVP